MVGLHVIVYLKLIILLLGIWIDLSDLLVEIGEAVYSHSFVRTLEMEKRWEKESHGVGYVPPLTYRSNLDLRSSIEAAGR